MADPELTSDEAMKALADLFSNGSDPCKSTGRTYILEMEDEELAFRRDEICLAIEDAINAAYGPDAEHDGNDIVPHKLAKLFPGRSKRDVA